MTGTTMNDTRTDDTVIDMIENVTGITVGTAIATCATTGTRIGVMIRTGAIAGIIVLIVFISTTR
jgi:hypothetical protein